MTEDEKWNAVTSNNANADGLFYYAVKSTGIFCRPSCKSKMPVRENVVFFDGREAAIAAGFRPCKRCRPDLAFYQPLAEIANRAGDAIKKHHSQRGNLEEELQKLGVSKRRTVQIFKERYGVSPAEYANELRLQSARDQLEQSKVPITEIAYSLGFESLSAFFTFFRKNTGASPGEYRKHKGKLPLAENTFCSAYHTAYGPVTIAGSSSAIAAVQFGSQIPCGMKEQRTALTDKTALELQEFFAGTRKAFDIPVAPEGTPFQRKVWEALCQIPYGQTRTYKEIAVMIGNPGASRAVGIANNRNPLHLLIPCHRVIGAKGSLVGYAAGIGMKEKLLQLERNNRFI